MFQRYDISLSYQELLQLRGLEHIHTKHLKLLIIEIYKSLNPLNPKFMWSLFNESLISH